MGGPFVNPWKEIQKLNPDTEIWWDSSPVLWPNCKDDFLKGRPASEREWYAQEVDSMFWPAPAKTWVFKGCTTNPPLSWAVLKTRKEEWAKIIKEKRAAYSGRSKYGLFKQVYFEVVRRGAEALLPLFEASSGALGHVSGQVDMQQMRNEAAMREMGEELAALAPNVMVKIPGSSQGMPVFRHLASKGIATNATCVFTASQVLTVGKMVAEGRAQHLEDSPKPRHGWRAVCTHMLGRLEDSKAFRGVVDKDNLDINAWELRAASEHVVKECARLYQERNQPIKMLTCSNRLHKKDGKVHYPHIDMFTGGNLVYTVPPPVFFDVLAHYRDRELRPHWNDAVPAATMEKLSQVPYFRQAIAEDGFAVEQFNEIPSLIENEAEFVGATKDMIEYVGSFL